MSSLNETEYRILFTISSLLMIVGCVLQSLSIMVILKAPFRKFDLSPYFLNVAFSNTFVILVDFPPVATSAWAQKSILGATQCQIMGFLTGVGLISTFFTMTLSIYKIHGKLEDSREEFNAVLAETEPWKRHKLIKMLTNTWFCAIIIMVPPLFGWGSFALESGGAICAPNWRETTDAGRVYLVVLVALVLIIPMGVSIAWFMKIFKRSKQIPDGTLMTVRDKTKARKAIIMMAVGIGSFVLSWTPYCVCALISVFGGSEMFDRGKSFIPGIFAKASTVYNPLICLLVSKRFRTVAMKIICCCCKKDESVYADINQWPVVLIQRMSSEEERYTRRTHSYQATPCRSRSTVLEQTALKHGVIRETSV